MSFFKKLLFILPLLFCTIVLLLYVVLNKPENKINTKCQNPQRERDISPTYAEHPVFIHKTENKINTNCLKLQGKHDISPTYRCFDKDGNSYDPMKDWEEAELMDMCFQHKVDGTSKIVKKAIGKQSKTERLFKIDKKRNLTPFDPGKVWEPMNESDCEELRKDRKTNEVPKGISDF